MNIVVVGLGYVGAVTGACLTKLGHTVVGVDIDPHKLEPLERGVSPIVEPGLDELVASGRESNRLRVSSDLAASVHDADVVLVSVGTPARSDGTVDLGFVERVTEELGAIVADRSSFLAIVYRSTVPPGTVDGRLRPILERVSGRRAGDAFGVGMVPEFLREGSGVEDFFAPPFTVAGISDDRTLELITRTFAPIEQPIHALSIEAAESLKYACNAYHAVKITFANEIGRLLSAVDVDSRDVMRVFCEDHRLNISSAYLRPGFSFGGSCLPKDLRALMHIARVADVDVPMLNGIMRSNESHVRSATRLVLDSGERVIALLGLSFKPQTDDLRESPYVELAELLGGKGLEVRIFDPIIQPARLFGSNRQYVEKHLPHLQRMLCSTPEDAVRGAGVAVVATADGDVLRAVLDASPRVVLDLHGSVSPELEALPGYSGIAW
jgi:GDP-mannose 6-dehydrogenase